jgi:hypothetical protein
MAPPGIILLKKFVWRGNDEEWSNSYHMQGAAPANDAEWLAQVEALQAIEGVCLTDRVIYTRAYCYNSMDGSTPADYIKSWETDVYPPTGALADDGLGRQTGVTCLLARFSTGRTNSKGKPVYLFKYLHDVVDPGTGVVEDSVWSNQLAELSSYVSTVVPPGDVWAGLADPEGNAATGGYAHPQVYTHRLKRRGRRSPT